MEGLDAVWQPEEALVKVGGRQDNDLLDNPEGGKGRFEEGEIVVGEVTQPQRGQHSIIHREWVVLYAGFHLELKMDVEGCECQGVQARGHRLTYGLPLKVLKKILS